MAKKHSIKEICKGLIFKLVIVNMIGFTAGLIMEGFNVFNYWDRYLIFASLIGLSLWVGNEYLSGIVDRRYSWIDFPTRKLVLRLVVSLTYSTLVIVSLYLFNWYYILKKPDLTNFWQHNKSSFFVFYISTIIIMLVYHTVDFFRSWQKAALNEERLKRESIALQLQALRNQVDPHFLFNSLNTLTSLIDTDPKKAITFVKQLSNMFRYMLDRDSKEIINIGSELHFVQAYIFLQQIRFGENLKVEIDIKDQNFYVLPISLQLLIENAIKHNEVSSEFPLRVNIKDDEEYVWVSNLIHPKILETPSKGIGLENLKNRYKYFSDREVEVNTFKGNFIVKLPKIKCS